MDSSQPQSTVQAQYSFKGSNNDELCFTKGDIITLTQREEGGWWEGTLGDKTGWFPSNYVKEYAGPLPLSETIRPPEDIQAFRSVVFRDLLESERAHVAELRGLVENFLEPLQSSQILNLDEYTQLMCNFVEIVEMHEDFLQNLEESNDRVGKVFLTNAPTMKKIHQCYCAAHPRAIIIVDKYRDDLNAFMEKQGAAKPGLLVLTTGLSKPFRRLDKYSAILQELERHMESCHADRGDTQRSIAVYKDIASSCSATRRQKELELQILTGPIRGWQGQELSTLGEIIHMGSVAVGPEHKDRYFVLFPQTLLILSVSQRMSAFKYEGKLPLTGISVNRLEDSEQLKNAFEITGSLIDRIVAVCQGPNEANKWVDLLGAKLTGGGAGGGGVGDGQPGKDMKRIVSSSAVNIPQPPPHMSPPTATTTTTSGNSHPSSRGSSSIAQHMSQHKRSQSFNHHLSYNQVQQQHQSQSQKQLLANFASRNSDQSQQQPVPNLKGIKEKANWKITNLRPAPSLRPALLNGSGGGGGGNIVGTGGGGGGGGLTGSGSVHHSLSLSQQSTKTPPTYEEDALVLRVIEAYCAAYQSTARNTMHSVLSTTAILAISQTQAANYCDPSLCSRGVSHIACNGLTTLSNTCGAGAFEVGMDNTYQQLIVDTHNKLRSKVAMGQQSNGASQRFKQAARMATLQWDPELAYIAATNARRCVYGHDRCRNTATMKYAGQNIAIKSYYGMKFSNEQLLTDFINSWFSEYKVTTPQQIASYPVNYRGPAIGHFTQIVSDRTSRIGCAMVESLMKSLERSQAESH